MIRGNHKLTTGGKRIGAKIRLAALAAVGGIAGVGSVAQAQFVWDGGAAPNNNWNTATNWTADSGSPGAGDSAQWLTGTSPATSTVDLSQNESASDLLVDNVATTFNLNNFALTVGSGANFDGDSAHATFNGPGSVSFGAPVQLGINRPFGPGLVAHTRMTAKGGATVDTAGLTLGRYRGGGIVTVDGAGTVWNSTRDVAFGLGLGDTGWTYTQPRAQMYITNGAHFNHNTGSNPYHTFRVANNNHTDSKIVVDGAGSQLNITGNYQSNFKVGGYNANATFEFTNGGVLNSNLNLGMSFGAFGTGTNTYTISGAGSKMSAGQWGVALRSSDASAPQGVTVVNVAAGGTFEATSFDGSDRGISIGDRGRVSLQGGAISVPVTKDVALRDNGATSGAPATLEGNGAITSGNLTVEGDSIVRPGIPTGTLKLQNGSLTATSASAQFLFDLSTTNGAHDRIEVSAAGQSATIPGVINYSNIGSGNSATGILDFLLADTINYNAFSAGDITLNTDNLDSILAAAGYTTRVTGTDPTNPGEYRYFIAPDVVGTLDALRLQFGGFTGPTVATWTSSTAGDWHNPANWSGGVPNGVDAEARFLSAITGTRTVYADTPVTVGTMRFNNANTYHITGGASLTLEVSTGSALVDVQAGTQKINLPLIVASDTSLNVAGGAVLKISDPVTVNAGKNVTQSGAGAVQYESTVDLLSGASIQFGNSSHMASLTLGSAATATVTPGVNKVMRIDNVNVAAGRLDLKDNKLTTSKSAGTFSGGAYSGVQGDVASSYNFGAWDGPGLTTSMPDAGPLIGTTTIGVADASTILFIAPTETGVFAGQTVTGATTLAVYTYAGDLNFDGLVDAADYGVIDNWVQFPGTSGYANGDFNYDGVIDAGDYGIIDNTIQLQGAPIPMGGSAIPSAGLAGVSAVPEPAALSVLGVAAAGLFARRRRRR